MIIDTTTGKIKGVYEDNMYIFRGVPYAEPPIKESRFKATVKKMIWSGVLDTTKFGQCAMQNGEVKNISEDCLTLNIWTKDIKNPDKPVMVYIHGGGFTGGAGSDKYNWGENFADEDIVYVTINYRLGVFGFLELEDILGEEYRGSGNNGILDMIESLNWIKENICNFGGDKNKVTIIGESAGAKSVATLIFSPLAKGLFHQAILESGAYQAIRSMDTAKYIRDKMIKNLRLNNNTTNEIIKKEGNEILKAQASVASTGMGMIHAFGPVKDGYVIKSSPMKAIENKEASLVPILIGTNLEEARGFVLGNEDLKNKEELALKEIFGKNSTKVLEIYQRRKKCKDDLQCWIDVISECMYKIHSYRLAHMFAKANVPVYLYSFNWQGISGASHAQELPFVWRIEEESEDKFWSIPHESRHIGKAMNRYWKNFVKYGDPNGKGLIKWEKFDGEERKLIIFDDEITVGTLAAEWDEVEYSDEVIRL